MRRPREDHHRPRGHRAEHGAERGAGVKVTTSSSNRTMTVDDEGHAWEPVLDFQGVETGFFMCHQDHDGVNCVKVRSEP